MLNIGREPAFGEWLANDLNANHLNYYEWRTSSGIAKAGERGRRRRQRANGGYRHSRSDSRYSRRIANARLRWPSSAPRRTAGRGSCAGSRGGTEAIRGFREFLKGRNGITHKSPEHGTIRAPHGNRKIGP